MKNRKEHGMITQWGVFLLLGLATTLPLTSETSGCTEAACDGIDNDGDGQVDEDWDIDKDGYLSAISCADQSNGTDCNDYDSTIHPGAGERCGDGIDNNCNGQLDEDVDVDLDGQSSCSGDCDDAAPDVHSRAEEQCDGVDNDCSGGIDGADRDLDGSSDCTDDDHDGYTEEQGDCHDDAAAINPAAQELTTDGIDNNCDAIYGFLLPLTAVGTATITEGLATGVSLQVPVGSISLSSNQTSTQLRVNMEVLPASSVRDSAMVSAGVTIDLTIQGQNGETVKYNTANPPRFTLTYETAWLASAGLDERALSVCYVDHSGVCIEPISTLDTDATADGKITINILHTSIYAVISGTASLTIPTVNTDLLLSAGQTNNVGFEAHSEGYTVNLSSYFKVAPFAQNGSLDSNGDGTDDGYNGNYKWLNDGYEHYTLLLESDVPGRFPLVIWFDRSDARTSDPETFRDTTSCDEVSLKDFTYGNGYRDVLDFWFDEGSTSGTWSTFIDNGATTGAFADVGDCIYIENRPFVFSMAVDPRTAILTTQGPKAKQTGTSSSWGGAMTFSAGENLDAKNIVFTAFADAQCTTSAQVNPNGWSFLTQAPETLTWALMKSTDGQKIRALSPGSYYFRILLDNETGEVSSSCYGPVTVDLDLDGDGAVESHDCNDDNAQKCSDPANPACQEKCDAVDNDCDDSVDESGGSTWYIDVDGDGYGLSSSTVQACSAPTGYSAKSGDCNDSSAAINPGAQEVCNSGIDDDCDGLSDDNDTSIVGKSTWFKDADLDGYGISTTTIQGCVVPSGYTAKSGDCNDANKNVNPAAQEVCNNGVDDDCDGTADDGDSSTTGKPLWYKDSDADTYGNTTLSVPSCSQPSGYASRGGDCNDANASINPGAQEVCNSGVDDDCDGTSDDGDSSTTGKLTYYKDADGDGYGSGSVTTSTCSKPTGYVSTAGDCNDSNSAVNPAAQESCNGGVDDDCDGLADDSDNQGASGKVTWYKDQDGDGYGLGTSTLQACSVPTGYTGKSGDCNDGNKNINPGAQEVCNSGIDDDCDGVADDGDSSATGKSTWYKDNDADSFGADNSTTLACSQPSGYASRGGDCNDSNASISPNASELCDGTDNDCDGQTDEGVLSTWYRDADGDGYGNGSVSTQSCGQPGGYVGNASDCNDGNGGISPGATETCNSNVDDDCDGSPDDSDPQGATGKATYFRDADGDGYGDPSTTTQACSMPGGYVSNAGDCDDTRNYIYPGISTLTIVEAKYNSGNTEYMTSRDGQVPSGWSTTDSLGSTWTLNNMPNYGNWTMLQRWYRSLPADNQDHCTLNGDGGPDGCHESGYGLESSVNLGWVSYVDLGSDTSPIYHVAKKKNGQNGPHYDNRLVDEVKLGDAVSTGWTNYGIVGYKLNFSKQCP